MDTTKEIQYLHLFKSKIVEAIGYIRKMDDEEKLTAVSFWNEISKMILTILKNCEMDINILTFKIHDNKSNKVSLELNCSGTAPKGKSYESNFAKRSSNHKKCAPEEYDSVEMSAARFLIPQINISVEGDAASVSQSGDESSFVSSPKSESVPSESNQTFSDHDYVPEDCAGESSDDNYVPEDCAGESSGDDSLDAELSSACNSMGTKHKDRCFKDIGHPESPQSLKDGKKSPLSPSQSEDFCLDSTPSEPKTPSRRKTRKTIIKKKNVKKPPIKKVPVKRKCKKKSDSDSKREKSEKISKENYPGAEPSPGKKTPSPKIYSCTMCPATFKTKGNFLVHLRRHTGEKPFACSQCSACFSTQGNLKRHERTHTGEKPFECSTCGGRFTVKKSLEVHMRRHTGERPYKCEYCGRCFAQSSILRSHVTMHLNLKLHLCETCGKSFRQRSQLLVHTLRHANIKKHECTLCSARFLVKGDLNRHMRTHTGERPFSCTVCSKAFTRQQSLNEHLNRHFGLKPYKCTICPKAFAEMSNCYKHIKMHDKMPDADSSVLSSNPPTEPPGPQDTNSNTCDAERSEDCDSPDESDMSESEEDEEETIFSDEDPIAESLGIGCEIELPAEDDGEASETANQTLTSMIENFFS